MDMNHEINRLTNEITESVIEIRRKIHQNPELGFEELETSKLIADALQGMGILQRTGVGGTGVIGVIKGTGPGKTVAIRSDMDAMPIHEESGVPFESKVPGKMHACGHDAHIAITLGVAMVLHKMRSTFNGQIKLIFQPSEENLAGAKAMIADGALDDPAIDYILGYHNWPPLDAGKVAFHRDVVFAASDHFDITLSGKQGHSAHPHTAVDTITYAAYFITQLQSLVSREILPAAPVAISIGKIEGGIARNVIGGKVRLCGEVRGQSPEVMKQVETAIRRMLDGCKTSMRIDYELDYCNVVPALRNNKEVMESVLRSARQILGEESVVEMPYSSMGSEDLVYFTQRIPSAHLRIGSKVDGLDTMMHMPNYQCNELAIPTGIRAFSMAIVNLLN